MDWKALQETMHHLTKGIIAAQKMLNMMLRNSKAVG